MNEEITKMRKLMEEMRMSATEKDAEIMKLRLHLDDESRAKPSFS